jgi:hypothetical protein
MGSSYWDGVWSVCRRWGSSSRPGRNCGVVGVHLVGLTAPRPSDREVERPSAGVIANRSPARQGGRATYTVLAKSRV